VIRKRKNCQQSRNSTSTTPLTTRNSATLQSIYLYRWLQLTPRLLGMPRKVLRLFLRHSSLFFQLPILHLGSALFHSSRSGGRWFLQGRFVSGPIKQLWWMILFKGNGDFGKPSMYALNDISKLIKPIPYAALSKVHDCLHKVRLFLLRNEPDFRFGLIWKVRRGRYKHILLHA